MGKRWRKYAVGKYRLGQLLDQAVVCWTDENGKHHRRRLGHLTEIEARAKLDEFARGVTLLKEQKSKTIGEIWEAYKLDREKDGKLIANFDNDWKALKARFENLDAITLNTSDACRDYAGERQKAGKSASTIWTELTRLRSCINWARKRNILTTNVYVWVPTKPDGRTRVMTEEEVIRLIDACIAPHVRLFVILAISTAGRSGAICQLKWDKVDFEAETIDLRDTEIPNPLMKRRKKGRSIVPMTAEARAALQDAQKGALTDYVIEWDGEPIKKIRKGFMEAVKRAKLVGVTPHVLRHTVISWLDEDGIPMERISKLAGHRDLNTTRKIYSKPDVRVLRPAADVIDMRLKREAK